MLRRIVNVLLLAATTTVCLLSLLGLAGNRYLWAFLLDQPRVHYAAFLSLALAAVLLSRRWRLALVIGAFLALNLYLVFPSVRPTANADVDASFSIVHANLGLQKQPPEALVAYIREMRPDLISLQELTADCAAQLGAVLPDYVVVDSEPRKDSRGIAVLVRKTMSSGLRVESSDVLRFAEAVTDRPHIELQLSWDDQPLRWLSFHCKRPSTAANLAIQSAEYSALAAWFQQQPDTPAIAVGDFNATPWSQRVRALLRDADLGQHQTGFSPRPTWPSGPVALAGIPIDLCVHNKALTIAEHHVGPNVGSDHYPIYCRVIRVKDGAEQ